MLPRPFLVALLLGALAITSGCDGTFTATEEPVHPDFQQRLEQEFGAPLDTSKPEVFDAIQREYDKDGEKVLRAELKDGTLVVLVAGSLPTAADNAIQGAAKTGGLSLDPLTLGSLALNALQGWFILSTKRKQRREATDAAIRAQNKPQVVSSTVATPTPRTP